MKRFLILLFVCLMGFGRLSASTCFAESPSQTLLIGGDLYLDVYEDQKMTGEKIIAKPLISNVNGQPQVFWSHICITPFHDQKDVCLKMERFSTDEGTVRDFRLNKDHTMTFQIAPGPYGADSSSERNINVWIKLSDDDRQILDINCSLIFYSNIVNRKITKEWKQAKEPKFELPYKTVF